MVGRPGGTSAALGRPFRCLTDAHLFCFFFCPTELLRLSRLGQVLASTPRRGDAHAHYHPSAHPDHHPSPRGGASLCPQCQPGKRSPFPGIVFGRPPAAADLLRALFCALLGGGDEVLPGLR